MYLPTSLPANYGNWTLKQTKEPNLFQVCCGLSDGFVSTHQLNEKASWWVDDKFSWRTRVFPRQLSGPNYLHRCFGIEEAGSLSAADASPRTLPQQPPGCDDSYHEALQAWRKTSDALVIKEFMEQVDWN